MTKAKPKTEPEIVGPDGTPIKKIGSSNDFLNTSQLWLGGPGTGKTSTGSALGQAAEELGIPDVRPFFFWFEPGHTLVEVEGTNQKCPTCEGKGCEDCDKRGVMPLVLQSHPTKDPLEEIEKWFEWVAASPFNPLFIDTGNAYFLELASGICYSLGVRSATEAEDRGVTWTRISDTFRSHFGTLRSSGKTLIYLMHSYKQVKRVRSGEITETTCKLPGASDGFLKGSVEQILHFDIVPSDEPDEPDKSIIHCIPFAGIEAKDRWGILPETIDRGDSPEEGARAILNCFYDLED